ncbi:MAG: AAA family ATPase [Lachnospiraceae bacterium]|nr:AAA family ATPase [Lachnospiraceae bacterium]
MRLISLHIDNFGNLSDYDLKFDANPMMILHENGWGKSTLAAFIKVMFYGFAGETKKTSAEREREKYRPWKGGTYGGLLRYELDGKQYEIGKVFGSKAREDSCTLTDVATGLAVPDHDNACLGHELFLLDERSFMRSVFIAQNDVRVHEEGHRDIADGISAKIGNLSDATDDVNRYEAVMDRLNDLLNGMSPKRATGSIKQMDAHISTLQNTLRQEEALKDASQRLELQQNAELEKLDELRQERLAMGEKLKQNMQRGELLARREAFKHLWDQYEESKKALDEMEAGYANGLPAKEDIAEKLELWTERNALTASLDNKQLQLDYMKKDAEAAREKAKDKIRELDDELARKEAKVERVRKTAMVFLGIAIILFVAGATTAFVLSRLNFGIAIIGGGVLSMITALIIMLVARAKKKKLEYVEIDESLYEQIQGGDNADISQMKAQIAVDSDRIAIIETNVEEFLRFYEIPYEPEKAEAGLYELKQKILLLETKVADVEGKREEIKKYETANDMTAIMNIDADKEEAEREEIGREREEIDGRIEATQEAIRMYARQLDENHDELQNMEEIREELTDLTQQRDEDLHKYEMLTFTRDFLREAKQNFSAKYRRPLLDGFKKYYGRLSEEEVSEFQLDANVHMTRRAYGEARDVESYSSGNRDLVDICLRMALVDAMYQDEKPFVVMDDPFVNLDRKRTKHALDFLKDIAEEYQVIYFTCNESRSIKE